LEKFRAKWNRKQPRAGNKLTIKLTDDQQSRIKKATGRSITELNIDLSWVEQLADQDLAKASGGIHHEGM
jgi:hypothetical protein